MKSTSHLMRFLPGTSNGEVGSRQFQWRGGDVFTEKETLQQEYFRAKEEYLDAKKEHSNMVKEYTDVAKALNFKEDQIINLSNAVTGEVSNELKKSRIMKEISSIAEDLSSVEKDIETVSNQCSPTIIGTLEKEKSARYISVQKGQHKLENIKRDVRELHGDLLNALCETQIVEAVEADSNYQTSLHERAKTRSDSVKSFEDKNFSRRPTSIIRVKSTTKKYLAEIAELMDKRGDLQTELFEASHHLEMARAAKGIKVADKLAIIEQLNYALKLLNLEPVDIDALARKHLPDGIQHVKPTGSGLSHRNATYNRTSTAPREQDHTTQQP